MTEELKREIEKFLRSHSKRRMEMKLDRMPEIEVIYYDLAGIRLKNGIELVAEATAKEINEQTFETYKERSIMYHGNMIYQVDDL